MSGSLAEWASALAAIGALIAAVWAARTSGRLFRVETQRDVQNWRREEAEQASRIAAWCVIHLKPSSGLDREDGLLIHNSSDAPVFDVEIHSIYAPKQTDEPKEQAPLRLTLLPPGDYVSTTHPKFHWTFPEESSNMTGAIRPVTKNDKWKVTSITFVDASGIQWVRTGGDLQKMEHQGKIREVNS